MDLGAWSEPRPVALPAQSTGCADNADPERLEALALFNDGDRLSAISILDALDEATENALEVRKNIELAARRRDTAQFALEARLNGELTTADLIGRYEEITELDPGVHLDWVELGRLYFDSGKLIGAERAARQAAEKAVDEYDNARALSEVLSV